jgi:hypothetical protein
MSEENKGSEENSYQVTSRQQVTESSALLIGKAKRTIDILVYDYDDILLPHNEITGWLTGFFLQHNQNRFRYLCSESDLLRERGRRLIELARKYSTYIKLRKIPEGLKPVNRQYMVIDAAASMQTRDHRSFDYYVHLDNRARGRQLENHFDALWQRAEGIAGIHVTGLSG